MEVLDKKSKKKEEKKPEAPEPFEKERRLADTVANAANLLREDTGYNREKNDTSVTFTSSYDHVKTTDGSEKTGEFLFNNKVSYNREETKKAPLTEENFFVDNRAPIQPQSSSAIASSQPNPVHNKILGAPPKENDTQNSGIIKAKDQIIVEKPEQLNFFDEKLLTREAKQEYRIVGQVFDTYWIIEYRDKMLMIDQHAAHEKVKYEQILKKVAANEVYTQTLTPPVVISVTPKEADIINSYAKYFEELGFEIEDFGMNAFAIRGVPLDLFSYQIKDLFEEILTQMSESPVKGVPQIIREKIASMACKAAVKGNNSLSFAEADRLIEQLLELDNPYNCPHGRPTIISMSKYEVEKKFKRTI